MNRTSLRRVLAIMRKEVIQICRDPLSLLVIFAMPVVQLVIYGYGVNLDIKHIPLCVYDRDATQTSQDLLKHFQATEYFQIAHVADSYEDVIRQIDEGTCTLAHRRWRSDHRRICRAPLLAPPETCFRLVLAP